MQGDLSRETFEPRKHYTAVRLQQGRVLTDADFNEQGDIARHRHEHLARDVIGASGAPAEGAGFALSGGMRALAVLAQDANNVWIAGEDGVLLVSSNGGDAWTVADTGSTRHLRALARSGATGWAVGDGGTLLFTQDSGATWKAQASGTLQTLRGVAAFDAQHVWAVGDGGLALTSVDGGTTWTTHATGVARLHAVVFTSAQNGLAVGQGGAIVRSIDGGQSWTRVSSGTQATLRAVVLNGAQALAAGDGGTLLTSSDGGATWTQVASGSTSRLHALCMRNATVGWAAGDGGTLLTTSDGGKTWTAQPIANTPALTGLSVAGNANPWLVGGGQVWRVAASGAGAPATLPMASLLIGAGCYYAQGQHCVWEQGASLANQPDGGVAQRLPPGQHLIYLRAWQRHISALEDPAIREVALGGPDTATRARQIAQVGALALPSSSNPTNNLPLDCSARVAGWDALTAPPTARLAARAEPQLAATGVCDMAASAGYRRLENQLYRVEIHSVDPGTGAATFKWSRENGSVAYAVQSVNTANNCTTVRVAARGRDANLDLSAHDRVELVDDMAALQQRAGQLFEYLRDGNDALELVLAGLPTGNLGQNAGLHPLLRRWEQRPTPGQNALTVAEGSWIALEDGVQVRFEPGGSYRVGDYWQIPARTATADVEWPHDDEGAPLAQLPAGVRDGWARLGLVTVDAAGLVTRITDCREWFPPLTQLTQLLYVGGDGQEAEPGSPLAEPLRVRVARGALPLAGARVRFTVETGGGTLGSTEATTNALGQAECTWQLGAAGPQRVRANLLTSGGNPVPEQALVFAAMAQAPVQAGGGCAVTIGKGGNFERLTNELLQKLLDERKDKDKTVQLCICFLPGRHALDGLSINQTGTSARLTLHGCGPTAVITVAGPIALGGFEALDLRDLQLTISPKAQLQLTNNQQLGLHGLRVDGRQQDAPQAPPWITIDGTTELRMHQCEVGAAAPASVVVTNTQGLCEIMHNVIAGDLAFYGIPTLDAAGAAPPAAALVNALANGDFQVPPGRGQLVLAHNQLTRLNLGLDMVKQLMKREFDGLINTVVLQGNSFSSAPSLFAGVYLSVIGNHFTAAKLAGGNLYGVLVGKRAAASGNVGELVGDNATLRFLVTQGQFRGAANMVFTLPPSTP